MAELMDDAGFEPMYDETAAMFRLFADRDCADLPLYGALSRSAAADEAMMAMMQEAPKGQRRPVLLLAAVHDLLLGGAEHPLSAWYPTVSGARDAGDTDGDPYPAFVDFVQRHRVEVVDALRTRTTQTNEVNRSCLWFAAARDAVVGAANQPIGLIEVGSSAGLNLGFDRYGYDFGDGLRRGGPASAVALACRVRSGRPPLDTELPEIVARVGVDVAPIDQRDDREVRWLEACIWPEQAARFARFEAAVRETAQQPPDVIRGDAVEELAAAVARVPADAHVIVYHSWALTYLERSRRARFEATLAELGASRDLTWLSAEHPGCMATVPVPSAAPTDGTPTLVARQRWREGRAVDSVPIPLAFVHPHLAWMDWLA